MTPVVTAVKNAKESKRRKVGNECHGFMNNE